MPLDFHTLEVADGSEFNRTDRALVGFQTGVANAAGGSAGGAVTTAVSFPAGSLPASYGVFVAVNNTVSASVTITSKTNSGFNVVLTPTVVTLTLAAGTFDVLVLG